MKRRGIKRRMRERSCYRWYARFSPCGYPLESRKRLSYFRERVRGRDLEVDLVVTRGDTVFALEVTTAESHSRAGLEAFKQQVPSAHTITVGQGGIPLADSLSSHPEQFF